MSFTVREDCKRVSPCTHGGRIAELDGVPEKGLDFSASLNPFLHPRIKTTLNKAARTVFHYPDNAYARFRDAVAKYLAVPATNVVPGNGSMELIRLCATSILEKGDTVIVPAPTFDEYELACRLAGAEVLTTPVWEKHALQHAIPRLVDTHDVKMVFVCNPNNPTGTLIKREAMLELATVCSEHDMFLFVDEVFIELSDPTQSVAGVNCDSVFVLRSLTKSFAIPGLRVGYGVTEPAYGAVLESMRPPWNLNSIAAETATHLLEEGGAYLSSSRAKLATERGRIRDELAAIPGLQPLDSDANFLMVNVARTGVTSTELAHRMVAHGILVRDCSTFRLTGSHYIRIAVRTRTENDRLLDVLRRVLEVTP